ncbi:MAG: polysaccharide biosynthesis protein [Sphingobacteriales bacterium]|nr:polysaccharide biosynthesis protein [Sphingobacteriales bacterium]
MKLISKALTTDWSYSRITQWVKLVLLTGVSQVAVQAAGFVSGILIIRLLSIQEYALYTLANTFLGTMTMLADSGISSGVMAEGGKVWQDKKKLGVVLATGLKLRRKFGLISLIVTTPILANLLLQHGASWLTTTLIILSIIPAFFAALSDSFLEMAPKLHQDIKGLQKNQIEVSLGRLALSALFLFIFPFTYIAIIATSLPRLYGNFKLKKISARFASDEEEPDLLVQKQLTKGVKRTLPIVIYHCISGQISIWLVSFFGTTNNISELGALGRLSIIFNLFTILFSTLVIPRFSRMKEAKSDLMKHYLIIQATTIVISASLLFAIWLVSNQILWVFGENYSGLNFPLFLIALTSSIGLMSGICSQLVISRGWFMKPLFLIGVNFGSTVISLAFFNINSLIGILYFNIVVSIIAYFLVFIYGLICINKVPEVSVD